MSFDPEELREGVAAVFAGRVVPDVSGFGWGLVGRAPDTREVSARRERRRADKMRNDPEYAARRLAQARASYHRNKHKRSST